jgi:hypothetical protein
MLHLVVRIDDDRCDATAIVRKKHLDGATVGCGQDRDALGGIERFHLRVHGSNL